MKIPAIITNLSSNEVAQEGIALYEKGAVLEIKTTTRGAIVRLSDTGGFFKVEITFMSRNTLKALAKKLDALISYSEQLKKDNELFKQRECQWQLERSHLIEKNKLACNRVEATIVYLKNLEKNTN